MYVKVDLVRQQQKMTAVELELPPHHLIDNARVRLDDLDDLRRDILIDIIRDGDAMVAGGIHCHSRVDGLQ